jgi:hypothetical protein
MYKLKSQNSYLLYGFLILYTFLCVSIIAFEYEGVDLLLFKKLFDALSSKENNYLNRVHKVNKSRIPICFSALLFYLIDKNF